MKIKVNIGGKLLARASELTGVHGKTALVRMGLEALIARAGGTEKQLKPIISRKDRIAVLRRAAGMWENRTNLPDFKEMRGE